MLKLLSSLEQHQQHPPTPKAETTFTFTQWFEKKIENDKKKESEYAQRFLHECKNGEKKIIKEKKMFIM